MALTTSRVRFHVRHAAGVVRRKVRPIPLGEPAGGEPVPFSSLGPPPTPAVPHGRRILVIEDRVPYRHLGRGYPRSNRIVSELVQLGHALTLYPLLTRLRVGEDVHADLPAEVQVAPGGIEGFGQFWERWSAAYDLVFVSRPHNKAILNRTLRAATPGRPVRIIYDAEAVSAVRTLGLLRQRGQDPPPRYERRLLAREMALVEPSVAVVAVSSREQAVFAQHCAPPVFVLGHALEPVPTPRPMALRRHFLFVGPISDPLSPNLDAVRWFASDVLPRLSPDMEGDTKLVVAGAVAPEYAGRLGSGVQFLGPAEDLTSLYDGARVFVAPSRYASGIPIKVQEAAAHGVPTVATSLLADQLGWRDGVELLIADDSAEFAAQCSRLYTDAGLWHLIRSNALRRVASECSPTAFRSALDHIVEEALAVPAM